MHIVVQTGLTAAEKSAWNALLRDNNPFMRHEFLHGLETCGCATTELGWHPQHILAFEDDTKASLIGALPCYAKDHSYGEYIFDWAWADAYRRHGYNYYPKLCNAVPFTPATGPRWLVEQGHETDIGAGLLNHALELVQENNYSSFHSLFLPEAQVQQAESAGLSSRSSNQFHWHNDHYQSFDEFLAKLSSKKRKNIKRERRRVAEQNVQYRWLTGSALTPESIECFYEFYLRTVRYYGAQTYLTRQFFAHLAEALPDQVLILFAEYENQIIAGSFFMRSDSTLYGRYWGAKANFHSVHFETCYYQPIEYCINNQLSCFEAGAQGEHKLARGLQPKITHSAHWIAHSEFRDAINDFLRQEMQHISHYQSALHEHSPFRREV